MTLRVQVRCAIFKLLYSNQRGGGREGRKGFRNNYKGHMDKTQEGVEAGAGGGDGWCGGEWWRVNADNCT